MENKSEVLIALYNDLAQLQGEGKEQEAQSLLSERFAQLPEDVQGELLARLYLNALAEKVERENAIALVQEKGLATLEALDVLKKKIEEGNKGI
jgi:hypothetical protein